MQTKKDILWFTKNCQNSGWSVQILERNAFVRVRDNCNMSIDHTKTLYDEKIGNNLVNAPSKLSESCAQGIREAERSILSETVIMS